MSKTLAGLRVLDFGRYIAGPHCSVMLADHGAEVIRIERIGGGEDRYYQYAINDEGISATFLALNRNKRSMTLDPMHPRASEILGPLIKSADIVITNLPRNVMKNMGIDYESLCEIRPDIISVCISGFHENGPYADRVGLDGIAQAMSGAAYLTGSEDCPTKAFAPWVDVMSGTYAAFGAMAAVRHRDRTGQGQHVTADLFTTAVSGLSWIHTEQDATRIDRKADGSRTQSSAPGDIIRTKDGWILMQTVGPFLFKRWAQLMGEEEWVTDPRFENDLTRSNNRDILCKRTQKWAADKTMEEVLSLMSEARIPCGPVMSPQQVLDDSHVKTTGMFEEVGYPGLDKPAKVIAHPLRFSSMTTGIEKRPPSLGEDTRDILLSLGFERQSIDEFYKNKVI